MKSTYILSIIAACILIGAGLYIVVIQNIPESDVIEDEIDDEDDVPIVVGDQVYVDAVNSFACDFFKEIYAGDENVFISPYSIFTALAMTYEGAMGDTADEMEDVLSIQQDNVSFHAYMKGLYDLLNVQDKDYDISTANALWVKEDFELLSEYLSVIQNFYGGDATKVDFSNPQDAADTINLWVEEQTNDLIHDLITADAIDPILTALILTNAIYFKGIWEVQFDPQNTTDREFEDSSGNTVTVPTMRLTETEDTFFYTETDEIQLLELPYTGDDLSMLLILPKENDLSTIIETVDSNQLSEWKEAMTATEVDIYLPSFTVETKYNLNDYLLQLGMSIPFTSSADFSGINGEPGLYIGSVIHKAYIDVNEEGTEAAAATAIIMELTANGNTHQRAFFNCDHPFLYIIQHKNTGTILFMGSINDPSEES